MASVNRWRDKALNAIIMATRRGPAGFEVWMSLTALRWAVFLVLPEDVLHNNTSATMAAMATFAPLWVWSLGFLFGAIFQSWAAIRHHYRARTFAAAVGVGWWIMITVLDGLTRFGSSTISLGTFIIAQVMILMSLIIAYEPEATA